MTTFARTSARRTASLWGAGVVLLGLCVGAYLALSAFFIAQRAQETPAQAEVFARAIDDALGRLAHLPFVLAIDPVVLDAVQGQGTEGLNPVLADVATRSGAEFVYLMDTEGETIASSNYESPDSLIGNSYRFRPYFADAMAGGTGRFYAVGVTTGRPGYFISEAVRDRSGTIRGVVVVKIGVSDLTRALSGSGDLVLVTNRQGVVLASTADPLIYGVIAPLTEADLAVLEEQQQFGRQPLSVLDWAESDPRRVALDGVGYVWTKAALGEEDWTLHLLSDLGDIRREALLWVAIGLTFVLALVIATTVFRAAQLRQALTLSDEARRQLEQEIEDRRTAEAKLETARGELVRKNQLAALGQLSASITHELGQPISAMRNYLAAEEIAADALPGQLNPQLSGLADRMQRILDQLRSFGRVGGDGIGAFDGAEAILNAVQLVRHTARDAGVALNADVVSVGLTLKGQASRFEQVIVNLLRNGIDAAGMGGDVALTARKASGDVIIAVADTGDGIGSLSMDALREPFFSTKPSGKGMGLGLAISAQIVNEMGGELAAKNGATGGAVFTVRLPEGTRHERASDSHRH